MPDTLIHGELAHVSANADIDPARSEPVSGSGWVLPAIGATALALIWGAYVVLFTVEMVALGSP